jgi:hypothetical protein
MGSTPRQPRGCMPVAELQLVAVRRSAFAPPMALFGATFGKRVQEAGMGGANSVTGFGFLPHGLWGRLDRSVRACPFRRLFPVLGTEPARYGLAVDIGGRTPEPRFGPAVRSAMIAVSAKPTPPCSMARTKTWEFASSCPTQCWSQPRFGTSTGQSHAAAERPLYRCRIRGFAPLWSDPASMRRTIPTARRIKHFVAAG